jgi:hypothetical protein
MVPLVMFWPAHAQREPCEASMGPCGERGRAGEGAGQAELGSSGTPAFPPSRPLPPTASPYCLARPQRALCPEPR